MKIRELLRLVFYNTLNDLRRIMLTSLGIIVGTCTIILVIAIGDGATVESQKQFSSLSADTITIKYDYRNFDNNKDISKSEKLNMELLGHIVNENSNIQQAIINVKLNSETIMNRKKEFNNIVGITKGYEQVFPISLETGNDLINDDFEDATNNVVIGNQLAIKYFGTASNAINQTIKIGDNKYKIIGVLKRNGDSINGITFDESIFIPYKTLEKNKLVEEYHIPEMILKVDSVANIDKTMKKTSSTMKYYMKDYKDYIIEDAGSRIEQATQASKTMSALLFSVGVIVLVVGGIGVMNILFASIRERTKEIGVLKALGCKEVDILKQFLFESMVIGIIGGVIGLIMSFVLFKVIGIMSIPAILSIKGLLIGFVFAIFTSGLFGFYPAYKASRLSPVEALSYE